MPNSEALITIATFETEVEASLARGALEAIGIRALVPGESSGSFHGMYGGGSTSPAKLQVFDPIVIARSLNSVGCESEWSNLTFALCLPFAL